MLHKSVESERGTVHYWISRSSKDSKTLVFSHGLTANHMMYYGVPLSDDYKGRPFFKWR